MKPPFHVFEDKDLQLSLAVDLHDLKQVDLGVPGLLWQVLLMVRRDPASTLRSGALHLNLYAATLDRTEDQKRSLTHHVKIVGLGDSYDHVIVWFHIEPNKRFIGHLIHGAYDDDDLTIPASALVRILRTVTHTDYFDPAKPGEIRVSLLATDAMSLQVLGETLATVLLDSAQLETTKPATSASPPPVLPPFTPLPPAELPVSNVQPQAQAPITSVPPVTTPPPHQPAPVVAPPTPPAETVVSSGRGMARDPALQRRIFEEMALQANQHREIESDKITHIILASRGIPEASGRGSGGFMKSWQNDGLLEAIGRLTYGRKLFQITDLAVQRFGLVFPAELAAQDSASTSAAEGAEEETANPTREQAAATSPDASQPSPTGGSELPPVAPPAPAKSGDAEASPKRVTPDMIAVLERALETVHRLNEIGHQLAIHAAQRAALEQAVAELEAEKKQLMSGNGFLVIEALCLADPSLANQIPKRS
jgi:hypothetical protein